MHNPFHRFCVDEQGNVTFFWDFIVFNSPLEGSGPILEVLQQMSVTLNVV